MNLDWGDRQRELHEQTLRFARERLPSSSESGFDQEAWDAAGAFGLCGLSAPIDVGGSGLDALTTAYVMEALGQGVEDLGLSFSIGAHLFACLTPLCAQREGGADLSTLKGLAAGRLIGANAITEAEAGSDAFALKTRAVRDGDDYVLDGVKTWVTNGPVADVFLVYASTAPEHGHLGVTAFVVERETAGVTVGQPIDKAGLRASPTSSLMLDGCRVPAANRVGPEGAGPAVFHHSMAWERTCLLAIYVGAAQRILDAVVEHGRARRQFRRPLGKHQAFAHRVADMKVRIDGARLLLYRAAHALTKDADPSVEVAAAKLAVSEMAVQTALDAIHLQGSQGVLPDNPALVLLADATPSTIFSGTSEIQRDLIARGIGL